VSIRPCPDPYVRMPIDVRCLIIVEAAFEQCLRSDVDLNPGNNDEGLSPEEVRVLV
jgi:hypothetical protein